MRREALVLSAVLALLVTTPAIGESLDTAGLQILFDFP